MKEAMFWEEKGAKGHVLCQLCPKYCTIGEGKTGQCRTRKNVDGRLYAVNYGQCTANAVDPIEKKPLYHFYPGSRILSLGTWGCNLRCGFCQNWHIAHADAESVNLTPEQVRDSAVYERRRRRNIGVAYTYNEPFIWYEFIRDAARLVREEGLKNVMVTNGYVNEEPLRELLPYIDAMNIDVKAFTEDYYRKTCAGQLEPVKRTVEIAAEKCHVEVTTLLVTGLNDSIEEITELVDWLAGVNPDIPLHLSRYFPNFEVDLPSTPLKTMEEAYNIAKSKLKYVYLGNVSGMVGSDTVCPVCDKTVIRRSGYDLDDSGLHDGKCGYCGADVNVVA
ncbi:MAG TPA: AmmeMemoRadiSam system radical SAM enzyme [Clostridia bacterium]|nr:AmmeMemoRadiSam system radical SAM enzyme [Clostridia bacterium]